MAGSRSCIRGTKIGMVVCNSSFYRLEIRKNEKRKLLEKALSQPGTLNQWQSGLQGIIKSNAYLCPGYAVLAHSRPSSLQTLLNRSIPLRQILSMGGIKGQHQAQIISRILPGFSTLFFHHHQKIPISDLLGSPFS